MLKEKQKIYVCRKCGAIHHYNPQDRTCRYCAAVGTLKERKQK